MSCEIMTGGGSGIGRAVCRVLAREGARVVVADLNHIAAEETKRELDSIGNIKFEILFNFYFILLYFN